MPSSEILQFEIDDRKGGLFLTDVVEVVRAVSVTPLPRAPRAIEGIINVRGVVVPVIDLRARFGLPRRAVEPADRIIIAQAGPRTIALRVDQASTVVSIETDDLEEEAAAGPGLESVAGVAKLPDGLLLVYDLCGFLSATEAEELAQALAQGAE